jgi:hypothetical protein
MFWKDRVWWKWWAGLELWKPGSKASIEKRRKRGEKATETDTKPTEIDIEPTESDMKTTQIDTKPT